MAPTKAATPAGHKNPMSAGAVTRSRSTGVTTSGIPSKIRVYVRSGHVIKLPLEAPKKSSKDIDKGYIFTVEPSLSIYALKCMLHRRPWIPEKDLLLLIPGDNEVASKLLHDDSTLVQCGIKDQDTLYACMDGSFELRVYTVARGKTFPMVVSGCFQTIRCIKEELYRSKVTPDPPERQIIMPALYDLPLSLSDDTTLVDLEIVKPYLCEMWRPIHLRKNARMGTDYRADRNGIFSAVLEPTKPNKLVRLRFGATPAA